MWVKGNNIWPLKTVALLYTLAQQMSPAFALDLHTRTPVTAVTPGDSARRWTVETPRGKVSCSYVLHATNAYVSYLLPHLQGPDGVIPTRGQVIATRASAPADAVTKAAWAGNGGFEYWLLNFPRPVEANETAPLVILGGAREAAHPKYEIYEVDDSKLNPAVSRALRNFLPSVFPGMYEPGREPEVEWSGIMGLTRSGDPFVSSTTTLRCDVLGPDA
jgi:glycine/D-amino acid oxidase-like deaminating enzyme